MVHRRGVCVLAGAIASCLGLGSALALGARQPHADGQCTGVIEDPDCPHDVVGCGKASAYWRATMTSLDETPEAMESIAETLGATDLISNDLDIEIVPNAGAGNAFISGSNTMSLVSLQNGLSEFTFMLRSQYAISSVVLNEGLPGAVTIPGASVVSVGTYGRRIALDQPYNTGQPFSVTVYYSGTSQNVNNAFTVGTRNGKTMVYTLSEPYYSATWWPCKDGDWQQPGDNADKGTLTMAITVPNTLKVSAVGLLDGVDALSGNRARYRFHHTYPITTYLVAFGAHPYNTYASTYTYPGGTMPFEINISPGSDTAGNRAALNNALVMLEAFRPVFGLYPFINERYGLYEFGFGGGMEHQTNSGVGGFGESLIAHETAHQWWGDWVTCRTWYDLWINEGMATYSEAIWLERKPGSTGLPALLSAMQSRRPSSFTGTVYASSLDFNTLFSSDTRYRKAGWVWHMLRGVMGDGDFWAMLGALGAAHAYSGATTADVQAVAESVYGASLDWFFQPWVYGIGAPHYAHGFQTITVGGQSYLELYVTQAQSAAWATFTMPIDVTLTGGGGGVRTIWNSARAQWYLLPVSGAVTGVALDADGWILTSNKTTTAFVPSPPKVIAVTPAPGSALASPTQPITVRFHKDVTVPGSGAFSLVGEATGSRPISVSYSAGTFTATITPTSPLAADTYTLFVNPTITSSAGALALDGEMADPASGESLPSGDGLAGGAALIEFVVEPPPPTACNLADVTGLGGPPAPPDGQLTLDDILEFVNVYNSGEGCPGLPGAACSLADVTGLGGPPAPPDGQLTLDDILEFINAYNEGCP